MTVLFVAADRREFDGLTPRLARCQQLAIGLNFAVSGELPGCRAVLAANGMGTALAAAACREVFRSDAVDLVVSTGFCGALNPALEVAQVVVPESVRADERCYPTARTGGRGVLVTTNHVVQTAAEKRVLYASGADAVDMEAGGVAEEAAGRGLPFCAIRVVTDLAGEDLAIDFNRARRADGRLSKARIVAAGVRHPAELIRLARRARLAARTLGDFIANCEF